MKPLPILLSFSFIITITQANPKGDTRDEPKAHVAGTFKAFPTRSDKSNNELQLGYSLYLPPSYHALNEWPLIIYLHGGGTRGAAPDASQRKGVGKTIHDGQHLPAVVLIPQCPTQLTWGDLKIKKSMTQLITDVQKKYNIDKKRVYLTGNSMGGIGTWEIAAFTPKTFAAIAPLSAYGDVKKAKLLKDIPIWAFHGAKDDIIPLKRAQEMVNAVKQHNLNTKFTVYPKEAHRPWKLIYKDPAFYTWLLKQSQPDTKKANSK